MPKVILVSPAYISVDRLKKDSDMALDAEQKSLLLAPYYKKKADEF
jgi:hypothetical protein